MRSTWLGLVVLAITLQACKQNRFDSVRIPEGFSSVSIHRFEKYLFNINVDSVEAGYCKLHQSHPEFSELFTQGIIRIGKSDSPEFYHYLRMFLTDTMVRNSYRMVTERFPANADFENELQDALARYAYFFPDKPVPKVYTYISGYNLSLAIDDSIVAVGLDRYLGRNTVQYTLLGVPVYLQRKMHPDKVSSDVIRAWLYSAFPFHDSVNNLLSNMIYEGEIMYLTKRMLPHQPDSLIFGFTPQQYKWCISNESAMWTYLIENKLLFSTNTLDINKMVNDAPFTSGFPKESPGRAAVWLGYRIVDRFMEKNQDMDLNELMNLRNYQSILNMAKYKP